MTSKKTSRILGRDRKVISGCLTREYPLVIERAEGCYIYDADGKRYLDFGSGVAVANIGHTNPYVVNAVKEQMKKALHCGFSDFYAELPVRFVELLLTFVPKNLQQAYISNSGTESVEAAYKLARWHTKKRFFIAFMPSFHGRTMGSLSLTNSKPVHKKRYEPFLPVKHVPYAYCYRCTYKLKYPGCGIACADALEKTIKKVRNVAGVMVEPIAGEGGYIVPPKEFHRELRHVCNKYNVLLCSDEVQSGCFRTGRFLALDNYGVRADIVSLSKAIGGGLPIGVTLSSRKIMDWVPGTHASTFGGNLVASAAGIASLEFMRKNKLGENAKRIGLYMLKRLEGMQERLEVIGDVRGKGLMIGVELVRNRKTKAYAVKERKKVLEQALDKGLVLLPAGESVIRFCPPLTITKEQADEGLDVFEKCMEKIK